MHTVNLDWIVDETERSCSTCGIGDAAATARFETGEDA
jgi:hypothetical protein